MKLKYHIFAGILTGVAGMTMTSCSSDFLKEELTTEYSTDYLNTNQGVDQLMVGLYNNLRFHYGFEWSYSTTNYGTDEFCVGADGSNAMWNDYISNLSSAISTVNINTTNAYDVWDNMYAGINAANTLLQKVANGYTGKQADEANGTAHFLRGFNYFKLVSQYGGVPIKTEPSTSVEREFTRATAAEVFNQIESDLLAAYSELPASASAVGKLTKSAAAHFLAKAYLWRASEINDSWNSGTKAADLDKVIKYGDEVIAQHPLATNYADLWNYTTVDGPNEQLSEIVLAAQFTSSEATKGKYGNNVHLYFVSKYGNLPGMARDIPGDREYQRLRTTYYTYNVYNHLSDSRLWKSFRTKANMNYATTTGGMSFKAGDRGEMFILNQPGDTRYDAVQQNAKVKDLETDKEVGTTFVLYPKDANASSESLIDDKYIQYYSSLTKYTDGSRNTISAEPGNRDGILARSAEDYFFCAEAYIKKGDYTKALTYLNKIRQRAAWKAGEDRESHVDGGAAWREGALGWDVLAGDKVKGVGIYSNRSSYYESNNLVLGSLDPLASNLDVADITSVTSLPAEDQAVATKLGVSKAYDVAMCFLLDEKTREMCGEFVRWEDLARTKTLVSRAKAFNKGAAPNVKDFHCLRPIPQTFLDIIQKDGHALTAEEKQALQNPGY
ncbi:MAG: RagB/SusD family nutrient uptake outer membrane protein [Prevotella sp.]|nr:RagB/SusD family nutrient uptake outer membrane protein [Prevotella sp.]